MSRGPRQDAAISPQGTFFFPSCAIIAVPVYMFARSLDIDRQSEDQGRMKSGFLDCGS